MADMQERSHLNCNFSIKNPVKRERDAVTPEHLYFSRRKFITTMGALAVTGFVAACMPRSSIPTPDTTPTTASTPPAPVALCEGTKVTGTADELGGKLNTCPEITNYNNFYEFSYSKGDVASLSRDFKTSPWRVNVGGLVNKPGDFSVEELIDKYRPEERIYRMRCVEAWSMVIPWLAFSLNRLIEDVQPEAEARFVRFISFYDAQQMPGDRALPFPYVEGLRLDEALHDLTVLATGLYGKPLSPQNGAPIRLIVPWKYGFKSAKSISKIELTADMPATFWSSLAPQEYGFYANVNPNVDHPRWSQSSERRIGELQRRETLMFNGYEGVAPLYAGMDLQKFF